MKNENNERLEGLRDLSNASTYNIEMANVILYELFGSGVKIESVAMNKYGTRYFFRNIKGADTNPYGFKTMKSAFKFLYFQQSNQ